MSSDQQSGAAHRPPRGVGLGENIWHCIPEFKKTCRDGSSLDLKPMAWQPYGVLGSQVMK